MADRTIKESCEVILESIKDSTTSLNNKNVEVVGSLKVSEIDDYIDLIESGGGIILRVNAQGQDGKTVTVTLNDTVFTGRITDGKCDFNLKENGEWKVKLGFQNATIKVSNIIETSFEPPEPAYLVSGEYLQSLFSTCKKVTFCSDEAPSDAINLGVTSPTASGPASLDTIKGWKSGSDYYVTGQGREIIAHQDCSSMFLSAQSLEEVDFENFNTTYVTNMTSMFYGCTKLSKIDFSGFNTDKVENMSNMFRDCKNLSELNLNSFSALELTNMSYMFGSCTNLKTLLLDNFSGTNVSSITYAFVGCSNLLSLDLSKLHVSKATSFNYMFDGCSSLETLNIDNFTGTSTSTMNGMFNDCTALKSLNLKNLQTTETSSATSMFFNCSSLEEIDLSNADFANTTITGSNYGIAKMFQGCSSLNKIISTDWTSVNKQTSTRSNVFTGCVSLPGFTTSKTSGTYCKPIAKGGYFTLPS